MRTITLYSPAELTKGMEVVPTNGFSDDPIYVHSVFTNEYDTTYVTFCYYSESEIAAMGLSSPSNYWEREYFAGATDEFEVK